MKKLQWTTENILKNLLRIFLFTLPWQTILITRESFLNNVKWQYGTLGFYGSEILLWITVFVFIAWVFKHKKFRVQSSKFKVTKDRVFLFFSLSFVLWCFASVFWALDKDLALQHALHVMEALMLFLMILVGPLKFRQTGFWFVVGSVPVVLLAIPQFIFQTTWSFKWLGLSAHTAWLPGASIVASDSIGRMLRAYGSFSHPNVLGGYMTIVFLWSLVLFAMGMLSKRFNYASQYILSTCIVIGLFINFSRTALLASFLCLLIFLLYALYNKRGFLKSSSFLYIIFLFISLSLVFSPILKTRFSVASPSEVTSIEERSSAVVESLEIVKENKWLGVGIGNYTLASYKMDTTRPGWEYQPVHNVPMLLLTELGIIGIILVVFIFISFIIYILSFFKNKDFKSILFIFALFLIPYSLLLIFDHYLFSSYVGLIMTGLYFGLFCRFALNNIHK